MAIPFTPSDVKILICQSLKAKTKSVGPPHVMSSLQ